MRKINTLLLSLLFCTACQEPATPEITLEATANKIAAIKPVGQLQVMTSLLEDFEKEEIKQGPFSKGYIQIVRERCSFYIDLSQASYQPVLNSRLVKVTLPAPQADCLLQDSPFMSDDEEYWLEHLSNSAVNNLKKSMELNIKSKFNTPANRLKAQNYGEEFIKKMLKNLDLEAEISWVTNNSSQQ